MVPCRNYRTLLVTAGIMVCTVLMSLLAGIQYTKHINSQRKEEKFLEHSAEVSEVNRLLEDLEARFEISSLELHSLRNKTRRVARTLAGRFGRSR